MNININRSLTVKKKVRNYSETVVSSLHILFHLFIAYVFISDLGFIFETP